MLKLYKSLVFRKGKLYKIPPVAMVDMPRVIYTLTEVLSHLCRAEALCNKAPLYVIITIQDNSLTRWKGVCCQQLRNIILMPLYSIVITACELHAYFCY